MTDDFILQLRNLTVGYDRQVVLKELELRVKRGSFTGLVGSNGSGKSTLLKTILGIIPPLGGRVDLRLSSPTLPALGYVPQRESLDPIFLVSCFEMVLMGACGRVKPGRRFSTTEKEWARRCLQETGAGELERRRFSELSGGQKQRVLIARALATRPELLVLDDPTAGIDTAATVAVLELLRRVHREQQLTVLMVNHDLPALRECAEEVIWLHQGKVLQGSVEELLRRDRAEALLGLQLE